MKAGKATPEEKKRWWDGCELLAIYDWIHNPWTPERETKDDYTQKDRGGVVAKGSVRIGNGFPVRVGSPRIGPRPLPPIPTKKKG